MIGSLFKLPDVVVNKINRFEEFKFYLLMDDLPMEMVNLIASYNRDLIYYFEGPLKINWSDIRDRIEFILFQLDCCDFITNVDELVKSIDSSISVFNKHKWLYFCKNSVPGGGHSWDCYDEVMTYDDRVRYVDKLVEFLQVADHFIKINNGKYRDRICHLNDIYKLISEHVEGYPLIRTEKNGEEE